MEVFIINEKKYKKLLKYLDSIFTLEKVEINPNGLMGVHYYGLIFDYYFNDSVISVEYLDIKDYFQSKYNLQYCDTKSLQEQYGEILPQKRCMVIESVYNILYLSHYKCQEIDTYCILNKIKNYLSRINIDVVEQKHVGVCINENSKIGDGFYCDVFKISDGVVKKQLKKIHISEENTCKRFKYEYEMMKKLKDCSKIVNVYDYNDSEKSYTMEECNECLYDYLKDKVDLELTEKLKIIDDILEAMKYAHDNNVIHRDLHLGNIMRLNNDFLVCDFGLGKDKDVVKSLISSATPKNSHLFLDPIGLQDFTQLDELSDIYSIGKIIDYIMCNGFNSTEHIFSFIVLKCTSRAKKDRYKNISEIQEAIKTQLKGEENLLKKEEINKKIELGFYDLDVQDYIIQLVKKNKLCNYIVNKKAKNIFKIILKMDMEKRFQIAKEINDNYISSTGYYGWDNYSLFGIIAYNIYINEKNNNIKQIYYEIIKKCATYRFEINDLLDKLI